MSINCWILNKRSEREYWVNCFGGEVDGPWVGVRKRVLRVIGWINLIPKPPQHPILIPCTFRTPSLPRCHPNPHPNSTTALTLGFKFSNDISLTCCLQQASACLSLSLLLAPRIAPGLASKDTCLSILLSVRVLFLMFVC